MTAAVYCAVRAIGLALELAPACGRPGHMSKAELAAALSAVLARRLDLDQQKFVATAVMLAMPAAVRERMASDVIDTLTYGEPEIPFMSIRDAAASWASFASPAEAKIYLLEIWGGLSPEDRERFLRRVKR